MVVGLGNPGREYAETRHNIGFMILDRMAAMANATWQPEKRWEADIARFGSLWLLKPRTYMNLSGHAVAAVAGFYKIPAGEILAVFDDMALPLGKLRFRPSGSSGGHNGIQSIIDSLGTLEVPRLRAGIGGPLAGDAVKHVLGRFQAQEKELLDAMIERACAGIGCAVEQGIATAMNRFN
jgi:PTH1 family peptidyl-tRNA hydrolase